MVINSHNSSTASCLNFRPVVEAMFWGTSLSIYQQQAENTDLAHGIRTSSKNQKYPLNFRPMCYNPQWWLIIMFFIPQLYLGALEVRSGCFLPYTSTGSTDKYPMHHLVKNQLLVILVCEIFHSDIVLLGSMRWCHVSILAGITRPHNNKKVHYYYYYYYYHKILTPCFDYPIYRIYPMNFLMLKTKIDINLHNKWFHPIRL